MAVAGTHSGEPDWVGRLAPLPASTVETNSCPATQGTTTWIQAEGSAHVCMVRVRAQRTTLPSKAKCIRDMQGTVCGGGVERARGSMCGEGMEAQYQCH